MDTDLCLVIIREFTAPQALGYFREELEKQRQIPFMELAKGSDAFYTKLERLREHAYDHKKTKFNHRTETKFLVMQYAYAGAMELNDPVNPLTLEEVLVQFITAYNDLKKRRNESSKEVVVFPIEDEKLMAIINKSSPSFPSPESLFYEELSEECQKALDSMNTLDRAIIDALWKNTDELSHKEIAARLGIDPTYLSKRLKIIRGKLSNLL